MKTILISWDRYGYVAALKDVTSMSEHDRLVAAADSQNYWWESGGLENIPGRWELFTGTRKECREREKAVRIAECNTAWQNGNDYCQCGYEDWSHSDD